MKIGEQGFVKVDRGVLAALWSDDVAVRVWLVCLAEAVWEWEGCFVQVAGVARPVPVRRGEFLTSREGFAGLVLPPVAGIAAVGGAVSSRTVWRRLEGLAARGLVELVAEGRWTRVRVVGLLAGVDPASGEGRRGLVGEVSARRPEAGPEVGRLVVQSIGAVAGRVDVVSARDDSSAHEAGSRVTRGAEADGGMDGGAMAGGLFVQMAGGEMSGDLSASSSDVVRSLKEEEKKEEKKKDNTARGRARERVREGFDCGPFWDLWPSSRRVDMALADQAYVRACRDVGPDVIAAGLARWVAYWQAEGTEARFIPQPARWLARRRWTEVPPASGPAVAGGVAMGSRPRMSGVGGGPSGAQPVNVFVEGPRRRRD